MPYDAVEHGRIALALIDLAEELELSVQDLISLIKRGVLYSIKENDDYGPDGKFLEVFASLIDARKEL